MRSLTPFAFILFVAFAPALLAEEAAAVQPEKADTLDPEDIGIAKYVFEASPPAGKVMVLRCTHHLADGTTTLVSERINYTDGKKDREVVLGFDPTKFPFNPDQVTPQDSWVRFAGGETRFSKKQMAIHGYVNNVLEFMFTNDKDEKETLTFECFVEDYAKAKARIPDLPAERPGGGWGFNTGSSLKKSK
jgi:hypothetical protein